MIHIILLILKILGCIILGILALILAALLIILFVPFRYEFSAVYDDELEAAGKFSWLFGAVKAQGKFKDKKLRARVSVLWFRLFGMGEEAAEAAEHAEEAVEHEEVVEHTEEVAEIEKDNLEEDFGEIQEMDEPSLNEPPEDSVNSAESVELDDSKKGRKLPKFKKRAKSEKSKKRLKPEKPGLGERLSKVFEGLERKFASVEKQCEKLVRKKELAERFWNADFTQRSVVFVKKALLSILGHIRPKKLSGNIHFGFDKPSDTGRILGYASLLYAWYENSLNLYPDFEKTALDGNIYIRGSVQLFPFLYWGLRGILNKDLRKLLKYIKRYRSKEETLWQ